MMIIGVDGGGFNTKVVGPFGEDIFCSSISDYRERNFVQEHGPDDMEFEYDGIKGFAGTLAKEEREFGESNMLSDSKAHLDAKLRILLALHRYRTNSNNFKIVVGQPIGTHTPNEKDEIVHMLKGEHTMMVNGVTKTFYINEVTVAMEGAGAFWSDPQDGIVRVIDAGSGTVNCATMKDRRYVDKDSFTLRYGMMTSKNGEASATAISRGIITDTSKKWKKDDKVLIVGGAADILLPYIKQYYQNSMVLKPKIKTNSAMRVVKSTFSNAAGFYNMGCVLYGD